MSILPEKLGQELYSAAKDDDLDRVRLLTAGLPRRQWSDILSVTSATGAIQVASYCLEQGAHVDDSVLQWILASQHSDPICRLLIERKAVDVDHYIEKTGTVLGCLASGTRHALARFALEHGADPNIKVKAMLNRPPLACAAWRSDEEMLALLLEFGAELERTCALHTAAEQGRVDSVIILLSRGADPDEVVPMRISKASREQAGTALHKAVEKGELEMIELRLPLTDLSIRDASSRTVAGLARDWGVNSDIVARMEAESLLQEAMVTDA